MDKRTELKTTKALVKTILEQDQRARNSDSFLYLKVLDVFAKKNNMDMNKVPVTLFLVKMSAWGFPPFESVRRARQKLQNDHPELRASDDVQASREENETVYLDFARGILG